MPGGIWAGKMVAIKVNSGSSAAFLAALTPTLSLASRELFQSHREREQHLALQFVGNDVVVGIDADV
ncbi:hypothetical protein, partial [uncultured Cardiobacterium sp.]|uniref:hypothetical protein n=1 Tax=uncultured Cardiobacterium sp. TaxID=417619 RepID=UPI002636AE6F